MIIDVRKLKFSGKFLLDFDFKYEPLGDCILIPDAQVDGAVSVTGTLELHEDDVYVDAHIICNIVGKCARCLEDAKYTYEDDFSVKYVRNNPVNDEEGEYLYKSGVVDLRQAVDEFLLINAPKIIYCKDDCKGLCPICGCNLNTKGCDCKF